MLLSQPGLPSHVCPRQPEQALKRQKKKQSNVLQALSHRPAGAKLQAHLSCSFLDQNQSLGLLQLLQLQIPTAQVSTLSWTALIPELDRTEP